MPKRIETFQPAYMPASKPLYEASTDRKKDVAWYKTPRWRKLSVAYLRRHPLCESCKVEPASDTDHRIPRKSRPDLAYEWDNLQALCKSCHSRKTFAERRGRPDPGASIDTHQQ